VEKIRKIIEWLWRNKERMVLGVVVLVLISRVYGVLNPKTPPAIPNYDPPKSQPPTSEERAELGFPVRPVPPAPLVPAVWKPLWDRNPFWYNASVGGSAANQNTEAIDPGIRLLRINTLPDGTARAQIETASSMKKWYTEGEPFLKYELISIDPAAQECVLYSEELGRRFTIRKEQ